MVPDTHHHDVIWFALLAVWTGHGVDGVGADLVGFERWYFGVVAGERFVWVLTVEISSHLYEFFVDFLIGGAATGILIVLMVVKFLRFVQFFALLVLAHQ